jgi:hypothetical protein
VVLILAYVLCAKHTLNGKVRCIPSKQSQPPLHFALNNHPPQQAEDPRRSSILAHFLCAIRITALLACLIVEMVTTCAACMWVICANPTFLGVCPCLFSDAHHTCCILVLCPSGILDLSSCFNSLSLITPTPFHLLPPSPRSLRYNKQAPHSSRHHLLVQIPEATRAAHSSARGALLAERCVASCVSMPVQ